MGHLSYWGNWHWGNLGRVHGNFYLGQDKGNSKRLPKIETDNFNLIRNILQYLIIIWDDVTIGPLMFWDKWDYANQGFVFWGQVAMAELLQPFDRNSPDNK